MGPLERHTSGLSICVTGEQEHVCNSSSSPLLFRRVQWRHMRASLTGGTVAVAVLLACVSPSLAKDTYREPRTDTVFPGRVSFAYEGVTHTLSITGFTVRKKFFLSIYSMAHYMREPKTGTVQEVLGTILNDGVPKQITMNFVRNVSAKRIQKSLVEGFHKNATVAELEEIQPLVQVFARSVHKDAKENDQFVMRWLPGGTIISFYQGKEVSAIRSTTFARILWSIWFGEQSIVDRNSLIQLLIPAL